MEQTNPIYGRRLQLRIVCAPTTPGALGLEEILIEQDGFKPNPLRIVFDINYPGLEAFFISEIVIYNLAGDTRVQIIQEGARVFLSAGYVNGQFGQIFSGYVFQSLLQRENVTDFKLTLRCIDGYKLFDNNFTAFALKKEYTQETLVNEVALRSQTPIPIGGKSPQLNKIPYSRGTVAFGNPAKLLREITRWQGAYECGNTQMYFKDQQLYIVKLTDTMKPNPVTISPEKGGLLGTPQQTDYGVSFRCLLNPTLMLSFPPMGVKLDMVVVQQRKVEQMQLLGTLDLTGVHRIIGVRHTGDTRGDPWYTDVTTVSAGGAIPNQLYLPSMLKEYGQGGT